MNVSVIKALFVKKKERGKKEAKARMNQVNPNEKKKSLPKQKKKPSFVATS